VALYISNRNNYIDKTTGYNKTFAKWRVLSTQEN